MKTKIFNSIIVFSFTILFLFILTNRYIILDTVSYSLDVWINSLVPVMFPIFIISDILINYNIINYIPRIIKISMMKLFNISEDELSIFLLSMISGFPSNARISYTLVSNNIISDNSASRMLTFTHFANPMFVITTIGGIFLNNIYYGYIILLSHYIGNIIIGLLYRNTNYTNNINYKANKNKCQSFSKILIKSIKSSIDSLLLILGTLTCFLIISSLVVNLLCLSDYSSSIIKGIMEMTMGLKSISILNIPDIYKIVISCIFISFGGFAVHLQVISQIVDSKIKYLPFLIARIWHSIISGFICWCLYILIY